VRRGLIVAMLLASLEGGLSTFADEPAHACAAAGLAGTYFVAWDDWLSWTLMVGERCDYTSLRISGDSEQDVLQPTRGQGRLAQVDRRDVFILQSSDGEFAFVLTVVRAGARTYLVPTNQHLGFCIDWAQRREPRKGPLGRFLMRAAREPQAPSRGELPAICRPR
jgi:hypothetical protein